MGAIYRLALRQMSGKWRLLIMMVLSTMPVIATAVALDSGRSPSVHEFEGALLSAMLAGSIIPLVVLAIAAGAFGNEVEDRTLANLSLSPVPRWQIALPKFLAVLTIASPFVAVSASVTAWIALLGEPRAVLAVTGGALIGVAMYAAAFVWLGLRTTQAIGIGLLYIVVWEGFISGYVAGARLLSIRHYTLALMHAIDPRRFADSAQLRTSAAITLAAAVILGFLFLTVRRLRTMDVP